MSTSTIQSQIQPQQPSIGIVRAVNSGDSLVIQEIIKGVEQQKVDFPLSHLTVPRLGYHGSNDKPATKDLPFAWESKEFLRKKAIGKKVQFYIDYTAPTGKKFITCYLADDLENSLNKQMIESGWASLFRSASGKENKKPEYLNLIQLESEAISQELGIHNKNPEAIQNAVRPIHTLSPFDLFNKLKGKPLQAVVEQVRNANTYRVVIVPSFHSFQVQLSGIQSPGYKRDSATNQMVPEPFAVEAETFVSKNVLHRDVTLTLDTFDKQGNLYGTIVCLERDVAIQLLKNGFGTYVAWSSQSRSPSDQIALKQAEQSAKDQSLRIWSNPSTTSTTTTTTTTTSSSTTTPTNQVGPIKSNDSPQEINGKVTKIGNSGQISIVTDQKVEYEVSLASLKVQNLTKISESENQLPKEEQQRIKFERYFAYEAKEWLRKRLIGQRVQAKFEYTRPAIAASNLPEKSFYSVYLGKGNVSLGLVEAGLAKLLEHKGADNRAVDYEALITAENKAKKKQIGLFSNKDNAPVLNINDCSSDEKNLKAKSQKLLPHLRNSELPGVIDYVFSAQRFKIFVERESCLINFSLSGVRVPKKDENEELSNLALNFSRESLHQHDVTIHIDDIDKGGNFIGSLYLANKNYALLLVEQGFASVYDPMRKLSTSFSEAEDKAKKARLGVWKNYDPEEEKRVQDEKIRLAEEKNLASRAEFAEAIVRSVISPTELYVEFVNSKNQEILKQLEQLENDTSTESLSSTSLKVGDLVRARSVHDNKVYRGKILEVQSNGYVVSLYDLGDMETLPQNKVKPLPEKFINIPSPITAVSLAYLKASSNDDINNDAMDFLEKEFAGQTLSCSVHPQRGDSNKISVVLQDKQGCLNAELVRNGLVKVDQRSIGTQLQSLQNDEKTAISSRLGVWRFGNIGSDDEDESNNNRSSFINKKKFQKSKSTQSK